MRHKPKNTTFFVDKDRRAELFFQAVNMDHFIERYVDDLNKPESKRSHHLKPSEVNKVLQSGDVLIEAINDSSTHHYAIAFWKGRYYYANFYLDYRTDCSQLFAILITCYATNNKNVRDRYQYWLQTRSF
jgi:hypothetical protein